MGWKCAKGLVFTYRLNYRRLNLLFLDIGSFTLQISLNCDVYKCFPPKAFFLKKKFLFGFQKVKIMEAPSVTAASVSPPFLKPTVSPALAAPIHRKARILTRDPLREVEDDSMELQVEDDVRRCVFPKADVVLTSFSGEKTSAVPCWHSFGQLWSILVSPGSRDAPGRVQPGSVGRTEKNKPEPPAELHFWTPWR